MFYLVKGSLISRSCSKIKKTPMPTCGRNSNPKKVNKLVRSCAWCKECFETSPRSYLSIPTHSFIFWGYILYVRQTLCNFSVHMNLYYFWRPPISTSSLVSYWYILWITRVTVFLAMMHCSCCGDGYCILTKQCCVLRMRATFRTRWTQCGCQFTPHVWIWSAAYYYCNRAICLPGRRQASAWAFALATPRWWRNLFSHSGGKAFEFYCESVFGDVTTEQIVCYEHYTKECARFLLFLCLSKERGAQVFV